jgi:hypothetical protein
MVYITNVYNKELQQIVSNILILLTLMVYITNVYNKELQQILNNIRILLTMPTN